MFGRKKNTEVKDTFTSEELTLGVGDVKGYFNIKKWERANKNKLNPDGSLKEGWVRDWKNGGKLVYTGDNKETVSEIRLRDVDELKMLYVKAESLYKDGKSDEALVLLNCMINGLTEIGEIVGLYVFILLIDVQKELDGMDGALWAYDLGINYYSSISGEYVERWREHLQVAKDSYIKEEKLIEELKDRYDFPLDTPTIIALERLENLVVYRYIKLEAVTEYTGFDKVWRAVLNEVDYFEQGDSWNSLNKTTYKGAKNWLKSFSHLCKEDIPEEYKPKEV
jgi:Fe-S cluster biosynthesis and repair protein YggX